MNQSKILDPEQRPWLPDLDIHTEEGELVLHAELHELGDGEEVEVTVDGPDLLLHRGCEASRWNRLHLPFEPGELRAMGRSHDLLEFRILLPDPEPPGVVA